MRKDKNSTVIENFLKCSTRTCEALLDYHKTGKYQQWWIRLGNDFYCKKCYEKKRSKLKHNP